MRLSCRRIVVLGALGTVLAAAAPAGAQTVGPEGRYQPVGGALNRYEKADASAHWDTVRQVPVGEWRFVDTVGFLLPEDGSGRVAVYGCQGHDQVRFLGVGGCGGDVVADWLEGYAFAFAQPGEYTRPVNLCTDLGPPVRRFASLDPACEGERIDGLLGHLPVRQAVLNRYWNAPAPGVAPDHWETTRGISASHGFEHSLGFLADGPGPGRAELFSCLAGTDHFLSLDRGCEGRGSAIGLDGWIYAEAHGGATKPIYRCRFHDELWATGSATCEAEGAGQLDKQLGHLRVLERDEDLDAVSPPADCDDRNPAIRPGVADNPENGIDEDCAGGDAIDLDRDRDGVTRPRDCDDADPRVAPGKRDVPGNELDEDCSGDPARLREAAGSVTTSWLRLPTGTRARRLSVRDLASAARVSLSCRGRSCPLRRRGSLEPRGGKVNLLGLLRRRVLAPGTKLEIRITAPDALTSVRTYTVRATRLPSGTRRCLGPSGRPARC